MCKGAYQHIQMIRGTILQVNSKKGHRVDFARLNPFATDYSRENAAFRAQVDKDLNGAKRR